MITIRPFNYTESDYAAALAIQNAAWPDEPETVAEGQYRDRTHNPTSLQQRFMVESAGQPVAHARVMETHWSYRPGKYGIWITVHPDHQRQGIGRMIYDHILTTLAARPLPPAATNRSPHRPSRAWVLCWRAKRPAAAAARGPLRCRRGCLARRVRCCRWSRQW